MSDASADSPALPVSASQTPGEGWTQRKFFFTLAFVLAFHVALIVLFGTKKQIVPRLVTNVPQFQLADSANELIALGDPTLFARPNAHDVVTHFWRRAPVVAQPNFNWTENPRYLPPAPEDFGAAFREFVQKSQSAEFPLNFKPRPNLMIPAVPFGNAMPQATTMRISGELADRRLLSAVELPSLPRNDVVAPSTVQALVDTAGNVFSPVVLKPDTDNTADNDADQHALQLARNLRFAPAPRVTFGEITFIWHTVPVNTVQTNAP
jgi:hypothetical protein